MMRTKAFASAVPPRFVFCNRKRSLRLAITSLRANGRSRAGLLSNEFLRQCLRATFGDGVLGRFSAYDQPSLSVFHTLTPHEQPDYTLNAA